MECTEELRYIPEKISELIIKTKLTKKDPQVKFLKKYKEFVKLAITNIFKIKGNF